MKPYSVKWKETIWELMNFSPTEHPEGQKRVCDWWFEDESQYTLICGGERAGKSLLSAALAAPCIAPGVPGTYWIVGPDYLQARPEFEYLLDGFARGGFVEGEPSMPNSISSPWVFRTKWGATITTRSSSDIMKLASFAVHGIIMSEAAQQGQGVWLKLMGRVSQTGGFIILSGTLEDALPWYQDQLSRWKAPNWLHAKSFSIPTWSNSYIYPGGRQDPAILALEREYPEDLFMERFGAQPRQKVGAVLNHYDPEIHIKQLALDPKVPVELCIDPGKNAYAILFVQTIGLYTHVLDEIYRRSTIIQKVLPDVLAHPLWKHVDLARAGVIDIAGTQEQANLSQVDIWREETGAVLRWNHIRDEMSLINTLNFRFSAQNVNHEPLIYFNACLPNSKTPDGQQALSVLAECELWRWPSRQFRQNEPSRPIDANNHAVKALGYYVIDRFGYAQERRSRGFSVRQPYWVGGNPSGTRH